MIDEGSSIKLDKQLKVYKLFDANNQAIGWFFHYPNKQIIRIGDRDIYIETISSFRKKKCFLVDKIEKKQIGEYGIFGGGTNYFWQDVPSSPNAIIKIDEVQFNFRRVLPDVSYSLLKKEYFNYFKFRLYAVKGNEFYEYSLKMDYPIRKKPYYSRYQPFVGTIESNSDNIFPILCGFYLIEKEFDYEDKDDS